MLWRAVVDVHVCGLRASDPFSTIVHDGYSDISLPQQIPLCVLYVHNHDCNVKERCLVFFDAHGLTSHVVTTLSKLNVHNNLCIAQCYDGTDVYDK